MNKDSENKAVILGITLVFILSAFMPAVGLYKFGIQTPVVTTDEPTELTNAHAKTWGNLIYDSEEEECAGMIATGTVCKDTRSILLKNRHIYADNQKPRFFQGTNYTYYGVGSSDNMCRMGTNEKGLSIANFDAPGDTPLTNPTGKSDGSSGSEDNDLHIPLGNLSTVAEAAYYLEAHATHSGTNAIISSEEGVGALVCLDTSMNTKVIWINNTYRGIDNGWPYQQWDPDGNGERAQEIMDDIVNNYNSSEGDNLLNWKDMAQRLGKDTSDKEDGIGTFSYAGEISRGSSRSCSVHIGGNSSLNNTLHMSWLAFGPTTQTSIFLPIYAGNLRSPSDIPTEFSNGNGIHPYATVKHDYATSAPNSYYCSRVREIQEYSEYNENITFDAFDAIMNTIMSSADADEAKSHLADYVNDTLPTALNGYINNDTTPPEPIEWWNSDWQYRKEIIINHSKVADNLINFPVLISLPSDSDLSDDARCQNDGDDIIFTDYQGNQLCHEIEYFDGDSGELVAWVNVTSLSSVTDTVLYMYYGNTICGSRENVAGTWDSGFVGIWHMDETSGVKCYDSTDNLLTGTINGDVIIGETGIAGCCYDFDASGSNKGNVQGDGTLPGTDNINTNGDEYQKWTVEGWMNLETLDATYGDLITCNGNGYGTEKFPGQILKKPDAKGYWGADTTGAYSTSTFPLGKTSWVYGVNACDGSDTFVFWNGTLETIDPDSLTIGGQWIIADKYGTGEQTDGLFDEIRVSHVARNASWIHTTYNSICSPSTFFSVGAMETIAEEPILLNPSPGNGVLDVIISPKLSIYICDPQGDAMDVMFRTNASGSWETIGINMSVGNGTYYCFNTSSMNGYSTKYWWSVNVTDTGGSGNWTNMTFNFTTRPESYPPIISDVSPANSSRWISLNPVLEVTINDPDSDLMNVTWYWGTNSSCPHQIGTNFSASNGTYYQINDNNFSSSSTTYYWRITVSDTKGIWCNETYHFTTKGEYDFVIIAYQGWYEYDGEWDVERLRDWHNENDTLNTYIVNLSDILSNSSFWVNGTWGDGNPNNPFNRDDESGIINYDMFNDSAAKLRNYVRYAHYVLGVRYALLIGDVEVFPYRQLYAHGYGAPGLSNVIDNIPADMYFGCLNGTFNDDEDTYVSGQDQGWGENAIFNDNGIDEVDWDYEVAVGRFTPDTTTELGNCIRKTIAYMNLNGDEPYLYNITGGGDHTGWGGLADWAVNYAKQLKGTICTDWDHTTYGFNPNIYTFTWLNPNPNRPSGDIDLIDANIRNTMKAGSHVWVQGGHGSASAFGAHGGYGESWSISDVQTLTNTKYFLVLSSTNCQCARFDTTDCLSEAFVNHGYGAFASILNSRTGWGSDDSPAYQQGLHATGHYTIREYFDAYFNSSEGYNRLGDMLYDAKRDCQWLRDEGEPTIRFTNFERNLIGSPAVQMKLPTSPATKPQDPLLHNPSPSNGSINQPFNPSLSITVTDYQGDLMDIIWKNNATEMWVTIGVNSSVGNGTYYCYNTSDMSSYHTTYYWSIHVQDKNTGNWSNATYHFTTEQQNTFNPFTQGWNFYKPITINHSQVEDDLTNFPVLINIFDSDLHVHVQSDGDDILFMDDSGVANRLYHEIEFYNRSNGQLVAWVNVPLLSSTTDTIIYMYYGNPTCTSQENTELVWGSHYVGVWHLNHNAGNAIDSTSNNLDGIPVNSPIPNVDGKIGKCVDFKDYGGDERFEIADQSVLNVADITVSAWGYVTDNDNYVSVAARHNGWQLDTEDAPGNNINWWSSENSASVTGSQVSQNTWHYIAAIVDESEDTVKLYLDGSLDTTDTGRVTHVDTGETLYLGDWNGDSATQDWAGLLDEIRISDVVRSDDWIKTEYNNQLNQSTFINVGNQVVSGNQSPTFSDPSPSNGATGVSIDTSQLSIIIEDPEGDTFNWSIETTPDIGSNSSVNEFNGTKTCDITGLSYKTVYMWYVNVTDSGSGAWTNVTYMFITEGEPPTAGFTYEPSNPKTYEIVYFNSTSYDPDGVIMNWTWDFDDGTRGYGEYVTHPYTNNGSYTVRLTVKDDDEATDYVEQTVNVSNQPPTADLTYEPANPTTADIVYFNSTSTDPDGTIVNWTWDFGDGNISYEHNPTHQYSAYGNYTVNLTVRDDDGATDSISKILNVTTTDMVYPEISDVTLTMSDPIDTDPLYGWENITCTVTDNVEVDEVRLNITYPDLHTESHLMADGGGGGQYYYNTTFSAVGSYSYHIWANDTSDNSNTTTVNVFQIPPNWDIYVDGKCSVLDLVYVSNHYDEIGPNNGWIREDVDNNGIIKVLDLVLVANHYDETWP